MNNNNNLEKFIEEIESIKMTQYEKNEIRQHLSSFAMNYKPVVSPYAVTMLYTKRILAASFIAILSIGSLSQSLSYDALPGDTLYPVKIAHENLHLATVNSNSKKITYEIKRTEKRIQEAAKLAQEEKLDVEAQEEIAKVIKKQTKKVKDQIERVKQENPESALALNTELKSTIKANSEVLRKVTTKKEKREILVNRPEETKDAVVKLKGDTTEEVNLDIPSIEEDDVEELDINEDTTTLLEQDINTTLSEDTEDAETVEVSSAETLLDSLEEEVEEIQAFEDKVEQEIIKEETQSLLNENEEELVENTQEEVEIIQDAPEVEVSIEKDILVIQEQKVTEEEIETIEVISEEQDDTVTEEQEIKEIEKTETEDEAEISTINKESLLITNEIKSLEDILAIKKQISELRINALDGEIVGLSEEDTLNEQVLRSEAELFIKEKKYKQAFLKFQNILEFYLQETIEDKAEEDLGLKKDLTKDDMVLLP